MRRMISWSLEYFQWILALGIVLGEVGRYASTPLFVPLSLDHSDIIAPKNSKSCSDDLYRWRFLYSGSGISGPISRRASACPNLHEWWTNPLTCDAQVFSFWFSRNPAVFQDYLVNLINNLRVGPCFVSFRTRRNTGGKITTFKLGHPVFDGGIRWCMFP